ncbi:MAG: N-acetyl-gamma-glutamyl-phosphate reductase [Clostridia bacterium]|nr:N-acetyl-gamma-glutamyl-phosphate reductase [Clostridia bacterium]
MIKVGILGSTGYAGAELTRLLASHPEVEIEFLDSRSYEDKEYLSIYPNLNKFLSQKCVRVDVESDNYLKSIDIMFCALPHGLSQRAVHRGLSLDIGVVDLSADFRLTDPQTYEEWYKTPHQGVEDLKKAVYGLCEIYRDKIKGSQLVANPGCYPTSIILALYPLLKENLVDLGTIIIDSKSGVSGAGRNLSDIALYGQCNENVRAYGIGSHRHTPEIEQEISFASNQQVTVQFTPHLIPMTRGILSTIYFKNRKHVSEVELEEIYAGYYGKEYFIRSLERGSLPQTKSVSGSNFCEIGFKVDERTGHIVLVSAIDNLIKGAAGQAVQNMNIMMGYEESLGLKQTPIWP